MKRIFTFLVVASGLIGGPLGGGSCERLECDGHHGHAPGADAGEKRHERSGICACRYLRCCQCHRRSVLRVCRRAVECRAVGIQRSGSCGRSTPRAPDVLCSATVVHRLCVRRLHSLCCPMTAQRHVVLPLVIPLRHGFSLFAQATGEMQSLRMSGRPPGPGVYQPTPPGAAPLPTRGPPGFRSSGRLLSRRRRSSVHRVRPSLTSDVYTRDFDEVKRYGSRDSSLSTLPSKGRSRGSIRRTRPCNWPGTSVCSRRPAQCRLPTMPGSLHNCT